MPLNDQEKNELLDLKRLLPLAAVLFVKVENELEDYSFLHGEHVTGFTCRHQQNLEKDALQQTKHSPPNSKKNLSSCFTCSLENSHFLRWLREAGLIGNGHWTERVNRCVLIYFILFLSIFLKCLTIILGHL